MEMKNRGGGYEMLAFQEQKSIATKLMTTKSTIQNKDKVGYRQIRDDLLKQMGSLQRKRKSEIASENMRLFKKI